MQEHDLGVGDELVIEGGIRLTVLAVEAGEVLLGITAPEPSDVAGQEARQQRPRMTVRSVPRPSNN
jgi:sRNA-binding carbon storage regulator CsrA